MKISLVAACAVVAALQMRVSHASVEIYNARRIADKRSVPANDCTVHALAPRQPYTVELAESLACARAELSEVEPQFAYMLSQYQSANDEEFDPKGLA